jgi:hypothetical protein
MKKVPRAGSVGRCVTSNSVLAYIETPQPEATSIPHDNAVIIARAEYGERRGNTIVVSL